MSVFGDKSLLFKQVNNMQLDEMNYNLWRKASLDASCKYKWIEIKIFNFDLIV